MAIYGLSMKVIQRSKGESAVAAAAYRSAILITDARTGTKHDFRRKSGVSASYILVPNGCPVPTRAELWNSAETSERRKDSAVAREYLLALPHELTENLRQELALKFGQYLVDRHRCAVDINIHAPSKSGDSRNHHAHILTTMRTVSALGTLGDRVACLASTKTGSGELLQIRREWEILVNQSLQAAMIPDRVSAISLAAQMDEAHLAAENAPTRSERDIALERCAALDRSPEPKIGPHAEKQDRIAMMKGDGVLSPQGRAVRAARRRRAALAKLRNVQRELRVAEGEVMLLKWREFVSHPHFLPTIAARARRTIRRIFASGSSISELKLSAMFDRLNVRLRRTVRVTIPDETLCRLVGDLAAFRRQMSNKMSGPGRMVDSSFSSTNSAHHAEAQKDHVHASGSIGR